MNIKYIIVSVLILFLAGCATTKTIYHWGKYSDTLYSYTKEPSSESTSKHKTELMNIIEQSTSKNKRTPPGINFELAMLLVAEGNTDDAADYFKQEAVLFPESTKYVDLALKEMEAK